MKKGIITTIGILTISLIMPLAAWAQTSVPSAAAPTTASTATGTEKTTAADRLAQKQAQLAQQQTIRETNLKTRADNEINRRTLALTQLITRINTFKRLTADQKSTFTTQIQTEIANLTNLKTKIDADTDAATLKADAQSIVTEYRVFAFYIPQIRLLETADRIANLADQMTTYEANLQTRITQAGQNGQSVTAMQASLDDMKAKVNDAETQTTTVMTSIVGLTPTGYPGNKSALTTAKTSLMNARMDLVSARQDAQSIIQALRSVVKVKPLTPAATGSAAVSPVPTQ